MTIEDHPKLIREEAAAQSSAVQSLRKWGDWPSILTAVATFCAALAAIFSVVAAFRQETATYESQLYNRQVDAVATFAAFVNGALENSRVMSEQIASSVRDGSGASRPDLRNKVVSQLAEIDKATGVFTLVFPLEEFRPLETKLNGAAFLNREFIDSLDRNQNTPHTIYDDPKEAVLIFTNRYYRTAVCIPSQLRIMVDCAKRQLGSGHAVTKEFAGNCARSMYAEAAKSSSGSDAAPCYQR